MKTQSLTLLLLVALLGASSSGQEPDYDGELPRELRELARQIGCKPVPGFYHRDGMIDPPYLHGYLPGDREESAAFWCYRDEDKEKPYLLVFVAGLGYGQEPRITSTIPWDDYPGGLSLFDWPNINLYGKEDEPPYDPRHLPLDAFHYMDTKEPGPKGQTTEYAPLQESWAGHSTLLYRHEGRWLWLGLH